LDHFIETFSRHGYVAVFILMTLESACIPIPSEVTMVFAGAAVYLGRHGILFGPGYHALGFLPVVVAGVAGNLVGSLIAYGVGRVIGRGPLDRWGKFVGIRSHDIDRAEQWWAKRGTATVFFSRVLPVLRTFISLPAGIAEMPLGRFTLYTVAGCIPWVAALTGAGYALGRNYKTIFGPFRYATYAIALLVVAAFVLYVVRHRKAETTAN